MEVLERDVCSFGAVEKCQKETLVILAVGCCLGILQVSKEVASRQVCLGSRPMGLPLEGTAWLALLCLCTCFCEDEAGSWA